MSVADDDLVVGADIEGPSTPHEPHPEPQLTDGRRATLPGVDVVRVLPTRHRRRVGAWVFADCMLPPEVAEPDPMEVGPHPHIGLATATWLFAGEAVHSDSLGTEQPLRPGALNLMTAGHGIAHAELGLSAGLEGVQLWIAQPESTRHGENAFTHHDDLPGLELPSATGTVFMGALEGATSPARQDTPLVGAQLNLRPGTTTLQVDPASEHAVIAIDRPISVGEAVLSPGQLAYLPPGQAHVHLRSDGDRRGSGDRVMFLGGEPIEPVMMFWNFVARTQDEITEAWRDWQQHNDDRFGPVPSDLRRFDAPRPPWVREA